eukprot:snap_masked-scaffold_4-processed-gene-2.11-mRNA-1 protein AED:1.00 eAED:1.00 QI:0/0/0/0/1/1/3/0/465
MKDENFTDLCLREQLFRDHFTGRKFDWMYRQFPLILLFSLGWLANLVSGPLYRGLFPDSDYVNLDSPQEKQEELDFLQDEIGLLYNCTFSQTLLNAMVPIIVSVQCVRVLYILQRVRFNKKLSKYTEQNASLYQVNLKKNNCTENSCSTNQETLEDLRKFKIFLSSKFNAGLASFFVLFSFLYAFLNALDTCPTKRNDKCDIISIGVSSPRTAFFNLIPILVFLIFFLYVRHLSINYPDPFDIFAEMKRAFFPAVTTGIMGFVSNMLDPLNILDRSSNTPIYFHYALVIDFAIMWFYIRTIVIPIFLVIHKKYLPGVLIKHTKGDEVEEFTLIQVLSHEEGLTLFKAHLLNEFSGENLDFFLSAKQWEENFNSDFSMVQKKEIAWNIYNRWLSPSGVVPVNVPYEIPKSVRQQLEGSVDVPQNLFDESIQEIYLLMERDSFERFKSKSAFTALDLGQLSVQRLSF